MKNFDFKSQEHKSLVCIWNETSLQNYSQTIYDWKKKKIAYVRHDFSGSWESTNAMLGLQD